MIVLPAPSPISRRAPIEDRLAAKYVVAESGCWEWLANRSQKGYGRFKVAGRYEQAHRVSYELARGPIPEGLVVDHLCRNRGCVNPDHMEPVTNAENIARGTWATRTHCLRGHAYTPENTIRNTYGYRACQACRRVRAAMKREGTWSRH